MNIYHTSLDSTGAVDNTIESSCAHDDAARVIDIPEAASRQGREKANVVMCIAENNHYLGIELEVPISDDMEVLLFQRMRAEYLKHRGFWRRYCFRGLKGAKAIDVWSSSSPHVG